MSLHLDKRQRAMLREMGVRIWQPLAPAPEPEIAIDSVAAHADAAGAAAIIVEDKRSIPPPAAAPTPATPVAPARAPQPETRADARAADGPAWRLGEARAVYAEAAQAGGARWLVLAETPAAALQGDPFEGDAGKLLDNMLRAARLPQAAAALLAPLVRLGSSASAESALPDTLAALVAGARPDVVLVMGRLAAQALLQSREPFGKLRGQVHSLHGRPTIVTYDATYLLRSPAEKARAWDDLCLAMSLPAQA